ncbi:MAG: putative integral membrane protein [Planctomycetota bacterium]|jgi:uncharacterized integral membrane protein
MKSLKTYGVAVLLVLVVIVVFQNTETVETKLLFATLSLPRALLLISTLLVGIVIGLVLATRLPGKSKAQV